MVSGVRWGVEGFLCWHGFGVEGVGALALGLVFVFWGWVWSWGFGVGFGVWDFGLVSCSGVKLLGLGLVFRVLTLGLVLDVSTSSGTCYRI